MSRQEYFQNNLAYIQSLNIYFKMFISLKTGELLGQVQVIIFWVLFPSPKVVICSWNYCGFDIHIETENILKERALKYLWCMRSHL